MIIYMKKTYKKRSRKRSTKKRARRARRRTRRAGEYSKMHNKLVEARYKQKRFEAPLDDVNESNYFANRAAVKALERYNRYNFDSDGIPATPMKPGKLKKRARKAYETLSNKIPHQKPRGRVGRHKPLNARSRLAEQIILTKDETEPDKKRRKITFGKGGKRKRKTRRRRRRRR